MNSTSSIVHSKDPCAAVTAAEKATSYKTAQPIRLPVTDQKPSWEKAPFPSFPWVPKNGKCRVTRGHPWKLLL